MRYGEIRSDPTFIRIILLIQKALKNKVNYIEIEEINKYIKYIIKSNANACIKYIEDILHNSKERKIKSYMNKLQRLITNLLDINIKYEKLIDHTERIDNEKFNLFINIDNNIIELLRDLKFILDEIKSKGFNKSREILLNEIVNCIEYNIRQRAKLSS
jgi:predicted RND superfamily exporter protein